MKLLSDFVSRENKRYKYQLGSTVASGLTGFITGALLVGIVWYMVAHFPV